MYHCRSSEAAYDTVPFQVVTTCKLTEFAVTCRSAGFEPGTAAFSQVRYHCIPSPFKYLAYLKPFRNDYWTVNMRTSCIISTSQDTVPWPEIPTSLYLLIYLLIFQHQYSFVLLPPVSWTLDHAVILKTIWTICSPLLFLNIWSEIFIFILFYGEMILCLQEKGEREIEYIFLQVTTFQF